MKFYSHQVAFSSFLGSLRARQAHQATHTPRSRECEKCRGADNRTMTVSDIRLNKASLTWSMYHNGYRTSNSKVTLPNVTVCTRKWHASFVPVPTTYGNRQLKQTRQASKSVHTISPKCRASASLKTVHRTLTPNPCTP